MIVRTAAEGASVPELERDVRLLEKLWEVTRGHAERAEAPALVYAEPDLSLQVIRDDLRADVSEVVVDDERQYHRILAYVNRTSPELAERIKLYRGKRALFQRYEIEQGIRSTLRRRVDLPSGGSLVFDYAEAFTIVDVNTGRFTGKKRLEDTILKNNLEAAVEVVRQLRLRDIGGIIVIDFIDMAAQKNRDAVLKTIQKELEKDRSKSYVVEISPLGLVEMTRHNVTDGVRGGGGGGGEENGGRGGRRSKGGEGGDGGRGGERAARRARAGGRGGGGGGAEEGGEEEEGRRRRERGGGGGGREAERERRAGGEEREKEGEREREEGEKETERERERERVCVKGGGGGGGGGGGSWSMQQA